MAANAFAFVTCQGYDGVNEIVEDNGSNTRQRYYVHGVSYIDERLMMYSDSLSRPFYYVVDRMNNVRMLIDRAGAIVERYAYDAYGRPRIRESCGRGDMDNSTRMDSTDSKLFADAKNSSIWDPRADMDDDGDVDSADQTLYNAKYPIWNSLFTFPTVAQAFSDVDNPFMFQGVPHFALDTQAADGEDKLSLNHHRPMFTFMEPQILQPISRHRSRYNPMCIIPMCPTHSILVPPMRISLPMRQIASSRNSWINRRPFFDIGNTLSFSVDSLQRATLDPAKMLGPQNQTAPNFSVTACTPPMPAGVSGPDDLCEWSRTAQSCTTIFYLDIPDGVPVQIWIEYYDSTWMTKCKRRCNCHAQCCITPFVSTWPIYGDPPDFDQIGEQIDEDESCFCNCS